MLVPVIHAVVFYSSFVVPQPRKIGFSSFGHRKKRSDDSTDYICPLDASQAQALLNGASRPYSGFRGLSPIFDRDPERRVQVGALQIWCSTSRHRWACSQ